MMAADKSSGKQSNSDNHTPGNRKNGSPRPPEPVLKCPRCDSPNTKFCYYNNYNLSQPRHFCKTCRRYWTKGGALRNVPVGGGCRKNKKIKSSSRLSDDPKDSVGGSFDSAGFNLFHHGVAPSMEYHQYGRLPFSRLNSPCSSSVYNQLLSFGDLSSTTSPTAANLAAGTMTNPCFDMDGVPRSSNSLMGLSGFPARHGDQSGGFNWGIQENNSSMNVNTSLASSIESLSCINQDLHWRLQQQRLAMLYCGENNKDASVPCIQGGGGGGGILENQVPQNSQPILFQNLEISKPGDTCGGVGNTSMRNGVNTTEWLFENSYTPPTTTTTTSSNSNGNDGMMSNWNGVQAWSGMHSYTDLPQ